MSTEQSAKRLSTRRIIFYIILAAAIVFGTVYAYRSVRQFVQNWEITELGNGEDFSPTQPTATPALDGTVPIVENGEPFVPEAGPLIEAWGGAERVTVLIMGLDYRDWESGEGPPRTDTMILLTIDPLSRTAGMLSIPRDLWVPIPTFQYDRINTAYRNGEVFEYPYGGGPGLASATVEQLLGVPIDYYAQIDFSAFVRIIDEIEGLKLDIKEPIKVDPIGPKPPKIIQPGLQVLPGELALAYARARNTEGGDFDRAQRQQEVIMAVRRRVLDFDMVPLLLRKAPTLYKELSDGIQTNMSLDEAIQLGWLALQIEVADIRRGIISTQQVVFAKTSDGAEVLVPLSEKVREVRDYVFGTTNLGSPLADLSIADKVKAEGAAVQLLNGTLTDGVASGTAAYLAPLGLTVPAENLGNADGTYTYTTIIDYTGNPYTLEFLVDALGVQSNKHLLRYDPNSTVDVVVILGSDWVNQGKIP